MATRKLPATKTAKPTAAQKKANMERFWVIDPILSGVPYVPKNAAKKGK